MKKPSNPQKPTAGMLSRRNLLQCFAGAGAGLFTASLLGAAPSQPAKATKATKATKHRLGSVADSAGDIIWDDELQQTFSTQVRGIYGDGYAMLYDSGSMPQMVLGYDIHAGAAAYNNYYWRTPILGDLHMTNGLMVAPSVDFNGNPGFAAFPAKAISLTPEANFCHAPGALSNAVDMPNGIAYVAEDGQLYNIGFYVDQNQLIQSYQNWTVPLNTISRDTAILDYGGGQKMLAFLGTTAFLFDISSSTNPTLTQQVTLGGAPLQIATSGQAWYCVQNDIKGGYDLVSYPWTVQYAEKILPIPNWIYKAAIQPGKPVVSGNCIYFADAGGKFNAVDVQTGAFAWGTTLGGDCSQAEIYIEDGIAYLCNTDGTLFAIDLSSSDDPQVVQKTLGPSGILLGVENGVCTFSYVASSNFARHLAAIDMAGQVHAFSCESTLLADEMTGEPGNSQPATPVYHTYVQLLDPNKNPRAFCSVKISSYEDLTLSDGTSATIQLPNGSSFTGLATYTVSATSPVWLTTDANGALNLTIQATDITCPSLYLWANFMDRDEAIVIYPDHSSTQKLQSASASDLSSAQTYNGAKLLPTNTNTTNLASAIGQSLSGGINASMAVARRRQKKSGEMYAAAKRHNRKALGRRRVLAAAANPASYISFPNSTTNMLYQYPANTEATRPYAPAASGSFAFDFDDNGGITPSAPTLRAAGSPQLLGLSWSEFKSDIVHGVNKIKHLECELDKDAEQALHTIISDAGKAYSLVVKTFEDAVNVVAGLLKTLANDIKNAIEWLTSLFDWSAILANKNLIKGQVCDALADFTTRINGLTKTGCTDVHNFFAKIKSDFANALGNANTTFGSSTIASKQANNNDPKTVFSNGSLGPANHFHSKVKNNIHQTQMNSAAVAQAFANGGLQDAACTSVSLDGLKANLESALSTCATNIKDDLEKVVAALADFIKSFQLLVTDPGAFVENAFTDVLNLLTALIDTLLDAADLVVEAIIGVVAGLIEGLLYLATAPIKIPVITALWSAITGDQLSFLDLVCLMAAIPYTIIEKVTDTPASKGLKSADGQVVFWAIFTVLASAFDAGCDSNPANDPDSALSILDIVFDSIVFGLSYPTGNALTVLGGAYWACQFTPVAINLTNCVLAYTKSEAAAAFNAGVPYYLNAFSCVNLPGAIMMAFQEPDVYMGKDGLSLIPNILSNVVLAAKPGVNLGPPARTGVVVLDFALPIAGCIMTVVADS